MSAAKPINLALQGGGSHGAFTWGVLDRLLEDGRVEISAISGTSAGAMNAAALAQGMVSGAAEGARAALAAFWRGVADAAAFMPMQTGLWNQWWGPWTTAASPALAWFRHMTQTLSPYQFNPTGVNPLKDIVAGAVDFAAVAKCACPRLYITATNVYTGKARVFTGAEVTADVLAASACLPQLFQAVEIDGEPYWDGGYMGNPALFPLFHDEGPNDILLVQVNPVERRQLPTRVEDISNRVDEIAFNASLLRELRAVEFVGRLIDEGRLTAGAGYSRILMHRIDGGAKLAEHSPATKMDADWTFLTALRDLGRAQAKRWLTRHFDDIGQRATLDLPKMFG